MVKSDDIATAIVFLAADETRWITGDTLRLFPREPSGLIIMKIPGPDHPITITPFQGRVTVRFNEVVVAQTDQALQLEEAMYPAVFYIPRSDIRAEHYARTEHATHCPYKGEANYFSLNADGKTAENAVWTYEDAYPAVAPIKEHVAFYADKVTFEIEGPQG